MLAAELSEMALIKPERSPTPPAPPPRDSSMNRPNAPPTASVAPIVRHSDDEDDEMKSPAAATPAQDGTLLASEPPRPLYVTHVCV